MRCLRARHRLASARTGATARLTERHVEANASAASGESGSPASTRQTAATMSSCSPAMLVSTAEMLQFAVKTMGCQRVHQTLVTTPNLDEGIPRLVSQARSPMPTLQLMLLLLTLTQPGPIEG